MNFGGLGLNTLRIKKKKFMDWPLGKHGDLDPLR